MFGSIQNFIVMILSLCLLHFEEVRLFCREVPMFQLCLDPTTSTSSNLFSSSKNPFLSTFSSPQIISYSDLYLVFLYAEMSCLHLALILSFLNLLLEISFLTIAYHYPVHFCILGLLLAMDELFIFHFFQENLN